MTKAPWRTSDIGDAILGRRTRASLPPVTLADGPDNPDMVELELPGVDEVFVILQTGYRDELQLVLWPMKLGLPREDH